MCELDVNQNEFLWPEEEKLFKHVLKLNEQTLPYEEKDRGTFSQDYFSDYIMPSSHILLWNSRTYPYPQEYIKRLYNF